MAMVCFLKMITSSIDVDKASIDEIDDEICRIYDSIAKIDSYDVMMRKYFYKYSTWILE